MASQVSGIIVDKVQVTITAENLKSCRDLPVAKQCNVAISRSWGLVDFLITVSLHVMNGVTIFKSLHVMNGVTIFKSSQYVDSSMRIYWTHRLSNFTSFINLICDIWFLYNNQTFVLFERFLFLSLRAISILTAITSSWVRYMLPFLLLAPTEVVCQFGLNV